MAQNDRTEPAVHRLELTRKSSSINSITETDHGGKVSKERGLSRPSSSSSSSSNSSQDNYISWTSRLSYHLLARPSYKVRRFSSKGALLVLILNFLMWAGYGVPAGKGNAYYFYRGADVNPSISSDDEPPSYLRDTIPILFWSPAVLVLGLLADIRYGRRRIVCFGMVLLWLVTIVDCVRATLFYYTPNHFQHKTELLHAIFIIDAVLSYIASAAFLINSVQLGIDQLADASAEQVSSFIRWYVFTYSLGVWVFNLITVGPLYYCFQDKGRTKVLTSLAQVVFVSLALCLVTICGGWIKAIPIGDNPLKLIWQVLRFAYKHKFPVSRSALTYWEDEIPSRINLGKDKYGGPFTNEQVEDVKTFFRILSLTVPSAAVVASSKLVDNNFVYSAYWNPNTLMDFDFSNPSSPADVCHRSLYIAFPSNFHLWICLYVLCSEFVVYPLAHRLIPSMLKRIGLAFFQTIPESIVLLVLNIVSNVHPITVDRFSACCFITAISALQFYLLVSSFVEFICAQSPQGVKGFLIGFMWLVTALLNVIAYYTFLLWSKCTGPWCGTGYFFLVTVLSVVGFVVYCVVAKWYRHRERDDCPNDQAIVEEVFARRLANKRKLSLRDSFSTL